MEGDDRPQWPRKVAALVNGGIRGDETLPSWCRRAHGDKAQCLPSPSVPGVLRLRERCVITRAPQDLFSGPEAEAPRKDDAIAWSRHSVVHLGQETSRSRRCVRGGSCRDEAPLLGYAKLTPRYSATDVPLDDLFGDLSCDGADMWAVSPIAGCLTCHSDIGAKHSELRQSVSAAAEERDAAVESLMMRAARDGRAAASAACTCAPQREDGWRRERKWDQMREDIEEQRRGSKGKLNGQKELHSGRVASRSPGAAALPNGPADMHSVVMITSRDLPFVCLNDGRPREQINNQPTVATRALAGPLAGPLAGSPASPPSDTPPWRARGLSRRPTGGATGSAAAKRSPLRPRFRQLVFRVTAMYAMEYKCGLIKAGDPLLEVALREPACAMETAQSRVTKCRGPPPMISV
ncbi:hypothetical protein EYF80_026216 [Liparis tanakae]|uniref:Uncharacterized protein n=1 Tax=Liparis tanakae TaxID=230148 RepID=A0A4Z2HF70_9TELE|nr:hypothetical protein EYF80_026216 [Liparis tanakae]